MPIPSTGNYINNFVPTFPSQYTKIIDNIHRYLCEGQQESRPVNIEPSGLRSRIGSAEPTTPLFEQFQPFKAPLVRIEKLPGYVDIVYARDNKETSESRQVENLKADPNNTGFIEIIKVYKSVTKYIHTFLRNKRLTRKNFTITHTHVGPQRKPALHNPQLHRGRVTEEA